MEVLISAAGAKSLGPDLNEIRGVTPVLFQPDGTLIRGGQPITRKDITPKGAWLSLDILLSKQIFDYVDLVMNTPTIEWIQSTAAGFDHPLFAALAKRDIRLTNSDAEGIAISEFVLGSVLCEYQRSTERRVKQSERKWESLPFREISGTRWMIVGIGNIGNEIAIRARAFGVHVIGVKRTGTSPHANETIRPGDMTKRLGECDVVVFTSPLNTQTHHMGNASYFSAMKQGATFVNVGRGGLVDEAALIEALERGTPGVAILDVFETEPLPQASVLWTHPNVTITPHSSGETKGTQVRGQQLFLKNLAAFAKGAPLHNEVPAEAITGAQ